MNEIELKLSLRPGQIARLRRHPLLAAGRPVSRRLYSIYLDTPERDLQRRGITLRVRRAGRRWLQTLKAEAISVGALTQRAEWEMPLPGGSHDLSRFPPQALDLLQGLDMSRIGPVFVTDFRRTAWVVHLRETVMEVALDRGEIRADGQGVPLAELEIELRSGPPRALFDLALTLLAHVPMGVEPRSKAARGYALAGVFVPGPVQAMVPVLDQALTAGQAWPLLAGVGLAQMVGNVPGFLGRPQDIGYLHQLRVGLRRLRGVADLAKDLGAVTPAWDRDLKALMSTLNAARDWDVFLQETLPRLSTRLGAPALPPALHRHCARMADTARRRAQGAVADGAFTRLVLEIGRDLLEVREDAAPLEVWAAACLETRWRALRKRGRDFAGLDGARRHRLRIAAKRLRYIADVLRPVFEKTQASTDDFLDKLGRLQNRLGAERDRVMAAQLLEGMRHAAPAIRFDAGRLAGLLATRKSDGKAEKAWAAWMRARPCWRLRTRR
ncbi:MAG TPA: CHAD domain-containing protein [Thiobacillaceae bacterium]|nr:CHAD domain-containing protein [Thiobacillaceae bacterium]HNU63299.1 CHAD domain-containing protein [Thiobacillaceae bacterium]